MAFETYKKSFAKILEGRNYSKLILYGADKFTFLTKKILEDMGMSVAYMVWHEKTEFAEILDSIDLMYEDKDSIFVFVPIIDGFADVNATLNSYGYVEGVNFVVITSAGYVQINEHIDVHLGYTYGQDVIGFSIYGDPDNAEKKIVALGGSTTMHDMGAVDCWSLRLKKIFDCQNKSAITLYNGGISAYSSSQECIKLLRDAISLKPDVIITFSGFNDALGNLEVPGHPYVSSRQREIMEIVVNSPECRIPYVSSTSRKISCGIEFNITRHEKWIHNNRCMNALCKEFGIEFRAILQPTMFFGEYDPNEEEEVILEIFENQRYGGPENRDLEINMFYSYVISKMDTYPFLRNFTDIFSGTNGNYYDLCHATEKGNQIIAERVYDMLTEEGLI